MKTNTDLEVGIHSLRRVSEAVNEHISGWVAANKAEGTPERTHLIDGAPEIRGALTIAGHDYWVILEYGSSPAEPSPGAKRDARHSGETIFLTVPEGLPASKRHTEWYPIKASHAEHLSFIDRLGRHRTDLEVDHPGVAARGFIRKAVGDFYQNLNFELNEADKELAAEDAASARKSKVWEDATDIPPRKLFVTIFNRCLRKLRDEVRSKVPSKYADDTFDDDGFGGSDSQNRNRDGSHLRDAIDVKFAR